MALFRPTKKPDSFDVVREGEEVILLIHAEGAGYEPSIEDSELCMARTIEKLMQVKDVTKIVFSEKREFEYDYRQTQILLEIAEIYKLLLKQRNMFSYSALSSKAYGARVVNQVYTEIQNIIFRTFKNDPISAYVQLRRIHRRGRIELEKTVDPRIVTVTQRYMSLVEYILGKLEKSKLVTMLKPHLSGYKLGDRDIYRNVFNPIIKPDFMFTKLMATYPREGEEIDSYNIGKDTEVTVFKFPGKVSYLYHIMPPEFKLDEDKYEILDMARKIMAEHKPKEEEFTDPQRMRQVFYNIGHDLIEELSNTKGYRLRNSEIDKLTEILVRYTVGFGLIEVLLQDEKIQDVTVNSPLGKIPAFIVHGDHGDCYTNIIPTKSDSESWASKLRMLSGRPLDEADPILDTELELPGANIRVSVVTKPFNPTGLAFSYRRHRDRPWTLPLFIKYKMINPLGAGLLSFLVDGTRTMLIAGTRSSGKSSFLSSLLIEIMRRYRIITIEDTLELPVKPMRDLGYNIQSLKVASALTKKTSEVSASDGIRSTLRMGDSALIVGEVRSKEAVALYEAMRVGAAANVVAGTIHSDSPYGVYDRVVNDIGIPKTSFKATDVIIIANPVKSADGLHKFRRVTQITEIRKHWEEDPLAEGGFVDLMKYSTKKDQLEATDEIINGESDVLKDVAGNIKEFAGDWDAMWNNILLRAQIKEAVVKASKKMNDPEMLEAPFVIESNDQFHLLSEKVKEEVGSLDNKRIFDRWNAWLDRECKRRGVKR